MNPQLCVRTGSRGPQGFPFALSEDRWYDSSGAGRGLPLELAPQALIRERRSVDDSREDMAMVDRSHRECGRGVWGVPLAILALGLCVAPSAGSGDKVAPGRRAGWPPPPPHLAGDGLGLSGLWESLTSIDGKTHRLLWVAIHNVTHGMSSESL